MTRIIRITKTGPRFEESRSLSELLSASVDYISERRRQEATIDCVDRSTLPTDEQLADVHADLDLLVGNSRWVTP